MSQNCCCVPGCLVIRSDGVPLHRFPNPDTNAEKFQIWITNIGGDIMTLDSDIIYSNRRVCHKHFEDIYKYPKNRLCQLAIPVLQLSGLTEPASVDVLPLTSGIQSDSLFICEKALVQDNQQKMFQVRKKRRGFCIPIKEYKEYKTLIKQLKQSKNENLTLKKKYKLAQKVKNTNAFKTISKHMSESAKMFCKMQVTQSRKKKHGRRFTLEEKILALSLYKPSPKAYRLLSELVVLPSRRTLQSLLTKINLSSGINDIIFSDLKERVAKIPERQKNFILTFDEMAIAPGLYYNKKNDKIIGFVHNTYKKFADHACVFMIRSVVKNEKVPVAYYFCHGSTKAIELKARIKDIIVKLQTAGLKIVATVCDQGASNMAAINQLLNETKELYLRRNRDYRGGFFQVKKEKIYHLYDPPHLIKGIRNNLLTKNLKYNMNGKEGVAKWSHIIKFYNRSPSYKGVIMAPKLTAHHVIPDLIPKMRVKHCTQVFSRSVAVAIACMTDLGALEKEFKDTADLLYFFDQLFDSVNGSFSRVREGKIYRAAVTPTSPHHQLWSNSIPILKNMKFLNSKRVVHSIQSWVKTIENFRSLVRYLFSKGIDSLLLRKFNQDALENFFGAVRTHGCSNVMPTSSAFEGAFKTLLINNMTSSHSVGANCEKDKKSFCLKSLKRFLLTGQSIEVPTECEDVIENEHLVIDILNTDDLLKSNTPMHLEKCAVIGYCSGWLAQTAKRVIYANCNICKKDLEEEEIQVFHKYIKMKEYENKDWLCYPTRSLFDFFAQVEHICIIVLKEHASKKNLANYIKLIVNVNLNITFITCKVHNKHLLKYIIDKSVMFFIHNWCKDVNNVLSGKTTFWNVNDPTKVMANQHYAASKGSKRKK